MFAWGVQEYSSLIVSHATDWGKQFPTKWILFGNVLFSELAGRGAEHAGPSSGSTSRLQQPLLDWCRPISE